MLSRRFLAVLVILVMLFTGTVPALAAQSGKNAGAKAGTSQQKKANKKTTKKSTKKETKKNTKKTTKKNTKKSSKKATKKSSKKSAKKTTNKKTDKKKTTKKPVSRGNSEFDASKIIRFAKTLEGTPYKSGGTTPKGFDCSGFTMYVFKNSVGIDLPHSSSSQYGMGQALDRDKLVPGALVFFNTSGNGVSHVGIYIGDDKFIDSSNSKGVAVNSLQDKYWGSRYVGARLVK